LVIENTTLVQRWEGAWNNHNRLRFLNVCGNRESLQLNDSSTLLMAHDAESQEAFRFLKQDKATMLEAVVQSHY